MSEQNGSNTLEVMNSGFSSKRDIGFQNSQQEEEETLVICNEEGATERWVVSSLFDIANQAEKIHIDKYGNEYTNVDYTSRLGAIKELNRMKTEARGKGSGKFLGIIHLVD